MVDEVALGQVCSSCFGFLHHFSFHLLLHTHLSIGVATIGPIVVAVLSKITLTPPHELKQEVLGRTNRLLSFHYILNILYGTDRTENTASKISAVACVFVAAGTCLPGRWLAPLGRTHRPQTVCWSHKSPFIFGLYKLRGLSPQANYTDRATAAVGEVVPTFAGHFWPTFLILKQEVLGRTNSLLPFHDKLII
jgi:hypothetical protein